MSAAKPFWAKFEAQGPATGKGPEVQRDLWRDDALQGKAVEEESEVATG